MGFNKEKDEKKDHKKIIYGLTIAFILLLVDLYITIDFYNIDIFDKYITIKDDTWHAIATALFHCGVLSISFGLVYTIVSIPYRFIWKLKNREHWLQGTWLHIHDKENVGVGIVYIKQDFYNLDVSATNIKINSVSVDVKKTEWYYIGSEFKPAASMGDELVGCYLAHRNNESNKYGVHIFNYLFYDKKGIPYRMDGVFGDIFKSEDGGANDSSDKMGRLHLFKITNKNKKLFKKYLHNIEKLRDITKDSDTSVLNTDYVKTLISVINKNEIRKKYKRILEEVDGLISSEFTRADIELLFSELMCLSVLSDVTISYREVEILNDIIGTNWEEHYINFIIESLKTTDEKKIRMLNMLNNIKQNNFELWSSLKDLVYKASQYILECDGIVTYEESKYQENLSSFLK